MSVKRPAYRLGWKAVGGKKWGWDITLFDPESSEELIVVPASPPSLGWGSEQEARLSTAAALRELADRIERGEE